MGGTSVKYVVALYLISPSGEESGRFGFEPWECHLHTVDQ